MENKIYVKSFEQFSNENDWKVLDISDIKNEFNDIFFEDGGIINCPYRESESIIIDDLEIAVDILKYLDSKMGAYGIGGDPEDIRDVWFKLVKPSTTVKLALPLFKNSRWQQRVSFVFDNGEKYPTFFEYNSTYTESPSICKQIHNGQWEEYGCYEYDKYFERFK